MAIAPKASSTARRHTRFGADRGSSMPEFERRIERSSAHFARCSRRTGRACVTDPTRRCAVTTLRDGGRQCRRTCSAAGAPSGPPRSQRRFYGRWPKQSCGPTCVEGLCADAIAVRADGFVISLTWVPFLESSCFHEDEDGPRSGAGLSAGRQRPEHLSQPRQPRRSRSRSNRTSVGAQATPLASENQAPSDGGSQSRWRPISRRIAQ